MQDKISVLSCIFFQFFICKQIPAIINDRLY